MPDIRIIGSFAQRHEAEYARSVLEEGGIPSALTADDASGIDAGFSFVNRIRLSVRSEDLVEARELLTAAGLGDSVSP